MGKILNRASFHYYISNTGVHTAIPLRVLSYDSEICVCFPFDLDCDYVRIHYRVVFHIPVPQLSRSIYVMRIFNDNLVLPL